GDRHSLFILDEREALDIDTPLDFAAAEQLIHQPTAIFRITGNSRVGSGHLFHAVQLATELWEFRCTFLLCDCDPFVGEALTGYGLEWRIESADLADDLRGLRSADSPTVVINDLLDTSEDELLVERAVCDAVVSIEDLGAGPRLAHAVIN